MQVGFRQRLVNTRLIGAERAAALKQQRDLFEGRALIRQGKPPFAAAGPRLTIALSLKTAIALRGNVETSTHSITSSARTNTDAAGRLAMRRSTATVVPDSLREMPFCRTPYWQRSPSASPRH